jgi:XTP/dITP diphosphohydrolase
VEVKQIIIASNNPGKIKEIKSYLGDLDIKFFSIKEYFNKDIEIIEDGETFEENALKKAREISKLSGVITLADDSGLQVMKLDWRPGIYSARYAGENSTYLECNEKLLKEMENVENRFARYISTLALYIPKHSNLAYMADRKSKLEVIVNASFNGRIAGEPMGDNGFGYDSIFLLDDGRTMAQLSLEEKNKISHRAMALKKMKAICMLIQDSGPVQFSFSKNNRFVLNQ